MHRRVDVLRSLPDGVRIQNGGLALYFSRCLSLSFRLSRSTIIPNAFAIPSVSEHGCEARLQPADQLRYASRLQRAEKIQQSLLLVGR